MIGSHIGVPLTAVLALGAGCYLSGRAEEGGSGDGAGDEVPVGAEDRVEPDRAVDTLPDAGDGGADAGPVDDAEDPDGEGEGCDAVDTPGPDGPEVTDVPGEADEVAGDSEEDGGDGEEETGDGGITRTWVTVMPGSFVMGSSWVECGTGEFPRHEVRLTRAFEILSTEVTIADFVAVMGYSPVGSCGSRCSDPQDAVYCVSWGDAASYCNALSWAAALPSCFACVGDPMEPWCDLDPAYASPYDCPGYRLPTEAEWEYAARAGTVTDTFNGDISPLYLDDCLSVDPVLDPIAKYCANSFGSCSTGGAKLPNSCGLYDILGNVEEWCHDWEGAYTRDPAYVLGGVTTDPWGPAEWTGVRVLRGGGATTTSRCTRAASRHYYSDYPFPSLGTVGFRPARTLP